MTLEERNVKRDRMRFTKDTLSANLVLVAIVLDALYFVSIYNSDVGNYYYTWQIGASVIYNLLFMLIAFLCSEGVKSRRTGYTGLLLGIGVMQIVRIFYLPAQAHGATVTIMGETLTVMDDLQHLYVVACLAVSAVCCISAAVTSYINNRTLAQHIRSMENPSA
jgi:hypothetical protein